MLTFLVEESLAGRAGEIKEATVAIHVFGRKPDFDARFDSIVRAQATQLRRKLQVYYRVDGEGAGFVIELPTGGYAPQFRPRTRPAQAAPRASKVYRRLWPWLALALVVCCAAGMLVWRRGGAARRAPSLAVLPFQNFSGGGETDYFADGLVEDLTTAFSRVPGLRVAARTSAFHFRGRAEDIRSIGRQLGVSAVLEGSVRRQGSTVKVTAQLISAVDGYHLWSNTYEGPVDHVSTVLREITRSVAQALKLSQVPQAGVSHVPSPEAYDLYLRARYTRGGTQQRRDLSLPVFEQALKLDPLFAEAWASLASTHAVMAFHNEGDVEAHRQAAHAAARKALELDETIAETHVALASLAYSRERDWVAAERGFRRAIGLNPNYAYAHRGFAIGLLSRGRYDEALAELGTARELDPITDAASNDRAAVLYCARRFAESIEAARVVLELRPKFYYARIVIANCLSADGRFDEAVAEYERAVKEAGRDSYLLARIGYARARQGRREDAQRLLAEVEGLRAKGQASELDLAWIHNGLGNRQEAIRRLERAAREQEGDVVFLAVEPGFSSLHDEPAFRALLKSQGLPED